MGPGTARATLTVLVDLRSLDQDTVLDADLCVIGGGAAGITLARSFAGRELRVVLAESGGLEPDDATQQLYRGADVGVRNVPLHRSRLRYLGGSTNHWHGWCAPFAAVDLEQRAWIPHSGWPFPLGELAPFYDRARRLLGLDPLRIDGAGDLVPAAAEQDAAPLPVDPARLRAVSWQIDHPPTRFGEAFRAELAAAANLRVLLRANAVALERARDRAAIDHVELRSLSGRRARVRARRFVLACGGLENPRLLLASRSAEPQGLGNRRGLVGRFFMDHFQVELGPLFADRSERYEPLRQRRRASGVSYRPALLLAATLQRRERVANPVAFLGPRRPRDERRPPDDPERAEDTRRMLDAMTAALRAEDRAVEPPFHWDGDVIHAYGNQIPDPASRVRLGDEVDALAMPRLELDWRLGEQDRRSLEVLADAVGVELLRTGAGRLRLSPWLRAGVARGNWLDGVTGANHPMGTTRMAADPTAGVTDIDARVHGLENLYVAGSSLFPTSGWSNPTFTLLALTFRLADHLARELGSPAPMVLGE